MVGTAFALSAARSGLPLAILEKTALKTQIEPEFDGRVCAISLGSKRILEEIGAWQHMYEYAEPILDIRVTDGLSPFFLHYDHEELGDEAGGAPFGYILENRHIRMGLHTAAAGLNNITYLDSFNVKSIEHSQKEVRIFSDSGEGISTRLLVGADGRNSQIRELAGIGKTTWSYHQTAIVCTIEHELTHQGLAQERFFTAGPFAVLPMTDDENGKHRSSLVWVEPTERCDIYLELPEDEFLQEIGERVGNRLGKITSSYKRFSYPLSLLHAKKYTSDKIVLIGDAAHGMHPIAGQGVNLGLRDAAQLANIVVRQAYCAMDITSQSALAEYAKLRAADTVIMLATMDILTRLFSNNIIPIRAARDAGLWAVGRMPPLKRFFMRHAMGLAQKIHG